MHVAASDLSKISPWCTFLKMTSFIVRQTVLSTVIRGAGDDIYIPGVFFIHNYLAGFFCICLLKIKQQKNKNSLFAFVNPNFLVDMYEPSVGGAHLNAPT